MPHYFTLNPALLQPPVKRAAYSDRTSWLMAVMSALAYVPFEQPDSLDELAGELARESSQQRILERLRVMLDARHQPQKKLELQSNLKEMGFELVETFSISIPLVADTQAFLARLNLKGHEPMLVLAFRGTEIGKVEDIRASISANPTKIPPLEAGLQVHSGFYQAFKAVQPDIVKYLDNPEFQGLPLYITGHSLGGALAIVATHFLSSDLVAACYTFGSPRVGNLAFGQSIRTPVYRVINSADLVTRLPPTYLIEGLTLLLRWLPVIPYNRAIADYLERFRPYRHYGDMRYLTATLRQETQTAGLAADYPGLQLFANPPQFSRWIWLYRRLVATLGRAGLEDHRIQYYVEKLAYWASQRNPVQPPQASAGQDLPPRV